VAQRSASPAFVALRYSTPAIPTLSRSFPSSGPRRPLSCSARVPDVRANGSLLAELAASGSRPKRQRGAVTST
jgi:hypothetical protein